MGLDDVPVLEDRKETNHSKATIDTQAFVSDMDVENMDVCTQEDTISPELFVSQNFSLVIFSFRTKPLMNLMKVKKRSKLLTRRCSLGIRLISMTPGKVLHFYCLKDLPQ